MTKRIFIAGHNGMVGSSIHSILKKNSKNKIFTQERFELDLLDNFKVLDFFKKNKFDEVYLAAAKVGGIVANNSYPANFIYENIQIQSNIIHSSFLSGVTKLLFLGSSCIYPKFSEQPIKEKSLLGGYLEPTNEAYAIAKISGIKMCESYNRQHSLDYRSIMPTNLYGPGDNFNTTNSHVIPALIRRFHDASLAKDSLVTVWGTGKPMREFLHVNDMADASVHMMNLSKSKYNDVISSNCSHINIGTGTDCSIAELARLISRVVGYKGKIKFDHTKPDGTPKKLLDISKAKALGWTSKIDLEEGIKDTYNWFLQNINSYRSK